MKNLDLIDDISGESHGPEFLPGIPRQCKKCGTWARYEKPEKHNGCFTVSCKSCHAPFEIVIGMRGGRR